MRKIIYLLLAIFLISNISAISWGSGGINIVNQTILSGNLTNLSQMADVNIVAPVEDDILFWNSITGFWENAQGIWCKLTGCTMTGDLETSGNITADTFFGDGSELTGFDTTFYNASTIQIITGTTQGSLTDIQSYNNVPYNVSEVDSDLEMIVNFTEIEDFNQLIIRYRSAQEDEQHTMQIQIWDYDDSDWEDYGELPASTTYHILEFGVYDADEHIGAGVNDGVVQVRFYQLEPPPNKVHKHNFDWVTIAKGFGTPSGDEVDPHAVYRDGSRELTGNWDAGDFNITTSDTSFAKFGNLWMCNYTLTANVTKAIEEGLC